jgi:hypothetical protein
MWCLGTPLESVSGHRCLWECPAGGMVIVAALRLGGPPRSTTDQPLKGEYPSPHIRREESFDVLLYTQQGIRIICGEDRQNEQSDMTWVKRFIIFLVVGFALFYFGCLP